MNEDYEINIEVPAGSDEMKRALEELGPLWAHFDNDMGIFDWCGEFLKRNPEIQKDCETAFNLQGKTSPWWRELEKFFPNFFKMENFDKKWLSQMKAEHPFHEDKIRTFPKLKNNEEIVVVNYDAPIERYIDELKTRYKEKGLYRSPGKKQTDRYPSFPTHLFPIYLKIYDLREWQKSNGCESWEKLADCAINYIWEDGVEKFAKDEEKESGKGMENAKGKVRSQYEAAQLWIQGKYKEIMKYGMKINE